MAATAVEARDERWTTSEGRTDWLVPHPAVAALVPVLKARGAQRVLDLDCGVGRHALLFAEHGFGVEAIDGAVAGLDFARREAASRGLQLSLRQADADALPFGDESYDYVLSWNVIFHGTTGDVSCRLAEIWRVLKPGGLYQGTDAVEARYAIRPWSAGRPRHLHPRQRHPRLHSATDIERIVRLHPQIGVDQPGAGEDRLRCPERG
jgi:SAM-dependent methyltransferase